MMMKPTIAKILVNKNNGMNSSNKNYKNTDFIYYYIIIFYNGLLFNITKYSFLLYIIIVKNNKIET